MEAAALFSMLVEFVMGKHGKTCLATVSFSSHCGQSIQGRYLRGYHGKIGQLQLGRCHGDVSKLGLSMLLVHLFVCKDKNELVPKISGHLF